MSYLTRLALPYIMPPLPLYLFPDASPPRSSLSAPAQVSAHDVRVLFCVVAPPAALCFLFRRALCVFVTRYMIALFSCTAVELAFDDDGL